MCLGRRWGVVMLCFVGLLISIGSREVFSIVVTHVIQKPSASSSSGDDNQFHLTCKPSNSTANLQKDWDSSFVFLFQTVYFVGYILTQLPGGILAEKLSTRRVFGGCILLTSILTIAMRFAIQYHYWLVFVLRFLQGLVEGPSIPAMNGVLAKWALKSEKSRVVAIAYAGAYLSAAVASVSTGLLICKVSWGSALFIYGGLGVIWACFWLWFMDESPATCAGMSEAEKRLFEQEEHNRHDHHRQHGHRTMARTVPWKKILTSLPVSAIFVAAICRNWIFALLLTQIPQYYKDVYGMHASEYGTWSALPHVFMTVVVIAGGLLVDKLIRNDVVTTTVARKAAETIGFGIEASCIMALGFIEDKYTAIALLCVGVAVSGLAISGYQTNPLDLAPHYVSAITGVVRLGTIASVFSTIVAVKYPAKEHSVGSWQTVFIIAASLHFFGVLYYLIFASGERQPWADQDDLSQSIQVAPNAVHAPGYGAIKTENGIMGSLPEVAAEDYFDDEKESLLSRSMRVEGLSYSDDDDEGPTWLLSTI